MIDQIKKGDLVLALYAPSKLSPMYMKEYYFGVVLSTGFDEHGYNPKPFFVVDCFRPAQADAIFFDTEIIGVIPHG